MIWVLLIAVFARQPGLSLSAAEQADFIEKAREVARVYTAKLPNFICTETIQRYGQPKQSDSWKPLDRLVVDLAFSDNGERYKLITVNDKPTNKSLNKVGGAISTGEFGTMLQWVFRPKSQTKFQWQRSEDLRGRPVQVFSYHIDQKNSEYHVSWGSPFKRYQGVLGFSGELFVDMETHHVLRMTHAPDGIPAKSPLSAISGELDYSFTDISGETTLVPLRAEIRLQQRSGSGYRNSIDFTNYRKFSTGATLKFETK
jgi:hypothetical protein